jgi:serine protease Do
MRFHHWIGLGITMTASACAGRTSSATQADAAAHSASERVSSRAITTETAPITDFRRQFVAAAQAIEPAVVSIKSQAVVELGARFRSPFEGSPFEGSPLEDRFDFAPPQGKTLRRGIGSGVVVDTLGHVLTNNHVVEGADKVTVVLPDDSEHEAEVIGTDPKSDLAVVQIDAKGAAIQAARLGDSSRLQVGEWVIAAGSPFGLSQTVSAGIVSAIGRGGVGISEYEDFIQTDAAINPGNSGGPLVDLSGRVVGINTAIASRSGGNSGVGFAIPISMAKAVMDQLIATGKVVRGYIGLYIGDVSEPLARSFSYTGHGGALVQDVAPDGPGARAGIEPGDIIVERDGQAIADAAELRNGIAASPPGTKATLKVFRDGKERVVTATLGELPGHTTGGGKSTAHEEPARWGLRLTDPSPQLRSQLGLDAQRGALIADVEQGSAAAEAGLLVGDVVTAVGDRPVRDADTAQRLLRDAKSPVRLRIVRDGRGLFVMLSQRES